MNEDSKKELKAAVRQLEYAEDYLQGAANALPDLEREIYRLLEEVAALKEDLTVRRLAS